MNKAVAATILTAMCAALSSAYASVVPDTEQQALPTVVVSANTLGAGLDARAGAGSNLNLSRFDTPASVDTIDRRQLEQRGDINLVEAITRAPGLSSMPHPGNGGSSLAARGFTDTVSVMRLYDGMRQYGGVGITFPFDTWSVERIEVLRGPASVIYGEGAIGAVVNIVPRQPTHGAVQNEVQAAIGSQGTRRLAIGSGGALDEHWSYRIDASGERSDGWVDRGDYSNSALSAALRLDVNRDLYFKLSVAHGCQMPMRYFGVPLVDGQQLEALRDKNYNVDDAFIKYKDNWVDLLAHWKPNAATTVRSRLYQVDSDRHWRNGEAFRYNPATRLIDRTDNTEILHDQSQTGNTTDMTITGMLFGLKNQLSAGFDVNASSFKHTNNTYVGSSPSVDPFNPVPGLWASPIPTVPRYRAKSSQYALFMEDRIELNDRWSLLAGVRYDHADIERHNLVAGVLAYDKTFTNVGWRLGSVFQVTPGLALYGQVSKAADPVASLLLLSPANSNFDSATGRQVEIGVKQAFWGNRGEWTLAAYDINKSNLLTRDSSNPAQSIQVGERSSRGLEGTLNLAFAQGWSLEANAAVVRARFDDFSEASGGALVSRAGNTPPDVPKRLANIWLGWDFAPQWSANAGLRYVGARHADNANTLRLPGYSTTDLLLRWQAAPRTTLTLRAVNVFDRLYYATAYYTPTQWLVGPGRRVELALNQRF
jgi:iron complex outermembrane receptor protein